MDRKKLLIRLTCLIFFIFIVNYVAMKLHWYYVIWWFDMPMHFLGGFWLSLGLLWLFPIKDYSFSSISKIILGVLLFAIFWEIFEFFVDENTTRNGFNLLDTLSDVLLGLAGGLSAIYYFSKRIMLKRTSEVQLS